MHLLHTLNTNFHSFVATKRLQAHPRQDLKELREAEDALLKSYGWVDKNEGVIRIPIDEAMKLVLQRGLPSRPASEQQVVK